MMTSGSTADRNHVLKSNVCTRSACMRCLGQHTPGTPTPPHTSGSVARQDSATLLCAPFVSDVGGGRGDRGIRGTAAGPLLGVRRAGTGSGPERRPLPHLPMRLVRRNQRRRPGWASRPPRPRPHALAAGAPGGVRHGLPERRSGRRGGIRRAPGARHPRDGCVAGRQWPGPGPRPAPPKTRCPVRNWSCYVGNAAGGEGEGGVLACRKPAWVGGCLAWGRGHGMCALLGRWALGRRGRWAPSYGGERGAAETVGRAVLLICG